MVYGEYAQDKPIALVNYSQKPLPILWKLLIWSTAELKQLMEA